MRDNLKNQKAAPASVALLHLSVMLFGMSAVLGQFVEASAVVIAGGRVLCSSVTLLLLALATKTRLKLRCPKDYWIALFTGVILAVHWTTFFQAIQTSSVAIGTISFSAFPLFLTLLEPLVFHEPLRLSRGISALVLLVGVGITVPSFSLESQDTQGLIWGLVSALAYAVMTLANRYLAQRYPARVICLYEQGTAALVLLPALLLVDTPWTPQTLGGIAAIGLLCTALGHSLYVAAQRKIPAQTAGVISGMETVYGIFFAWAFLGEVPALRALAGGAVILGAAVFSSLQSSQL